MAFAMAMPWHEGEEKMQHLLKSPTDYDNPTAPGLSMQAANMLRRAPLLAVGTLDDQDRPWTTLWGGSYGFAQPVGGSLIGIRTAVDVKHDPVIDALFKSTATPGQESGAPAPPKMVGGLTIDLETRKRVKLYGLLAAGGIAEAPDQEDAEHKQTEAQLVVRIDQSLGNCPKYLNSKHITAAPTTPVLVSDSALLDDEAQALISRSDLFFISSSHSRKDMDTNHRGGPPGFVRVSATPDKLQTQIVWPEYSGNRLYQTLGNLYCTPRAGLVFPDFASGDVLYLTGSTEILVGNDAAAVIPRSNLAVRLTVTAARLVRTGLPFRGTLGERSPYNPKVRALASEAALIVQSGPGAQAEKQRLNVSLVAREQVTPDVFRLRFSLDGPAHWTAGQWVALDLSRELDSGYSHMRDDDPTSLNDDFVRTFTISSAPSPSPSSDGSSTEFEITIRVVGRATAFLTQHSLRSGLDVSLQGFGGEFHVEQSATQQDELLPFIAGGVGITPLLAALPELDAEKLLLLWSVRGADLPLVSDVLHRHAGLAKHMRLFVTADSEGKKEQIAALTRRGVQVERRRMQEADVKGIEAQKWYLCAGTALKKNVMGWFEGTGKELVFEDFNF